MGGDRDCGAWRGRHYSKLTTECFCVSGVSRDGGRGNPFASSFLRKPVHSVVDRANPKRRDNKRVNSSVRPIYVLHARSIENNKMMMLFGKRRGRRTISAILTNE